MVFQILVTRDHFREMEITNYIGHQFETVNVFFFFFFFFFWFMVVLGVNRYGASFRAKFPLEKQFLDWGPVGSLLCTNGSQKKATLYS